MDPPSLVKSTQKQQAPGRMPADLADMLSALFTFLVGNRAGCLAGRLAGRLTFAAATADRRLFQAALADSFDMFHHDNTPFNVMPL